MKFTLSLTKKIEYAEISVQAHGWTLRQLNQFKDIHLTANDNDAQRVYLSHLLDAIDACRNNITFEDIMQAANSLDIAS